MRRERKPPARDTRTARQKVIDYITRHPGCTAEAVAGGTRLRMTQVTPRISDLVGQGMVMWDGKGKNRAGEPCRRYVATGAKAPAPRPESPRCPTCGQVVRQSQALEAGDGIREA